ncbi:MAG: type I methionyl aminopeptidase [Bacilli bacterium]|jgi:methionyl aminopeptidase|nr:type I methionyl aminopeptidase [Bacilli bacterium]
MVNIKSTREINLMKEAGRVVGLVFKTIEEELKPGMTTLDIDAIVEKTMLDNNCTPAEKGYYGYPASACVSVNDTLIHGIPSNKIIIKEGDIVSVDIVANYCGYMADACRTFKVGTVSQRAENIVKVTKEAFFNALKLVKPGAHIGDICHAVQEYVESHGYNVTRDYTGHGIGKDMHEDPAIPNFGKEGTGVRLQPGMALCIEPMVLEGRKDTRVLPDGWTVKSKDGKLTAHYENTVIVTESGYEIITMYEGEE